MDGGRGNTEGPLGAREGGRVRTTTGRPERLLDPHRPQRLVCSSLEFRPYPAPGTEMGAGSLPTHP